ncbi:MAG: hypothetical protein JSV56_01120, partial [Methanomassiliicoccales archaeon]
MNGSRILSIILLGMMMLSVLLFYQQEVEAQTVDFIIIRDEPGDNGSWVEDNKYFFWEGDTFYAAGYNISSGYVEDVTVTWTSSNESIGNVTTPGNSTTFTPMGYGVCVITADYGSGITNDTGILIICTYDELIIRDAPDGGGEPVLNRTYYVGENDTFWASGYNDTYGFVSDLDAWDWWSSDPNVGNITVGEDPGGPDSFLAFFEAVGPGTCVVWVYHMGYMNSTGTITVLAYDVDYITIRDVPNGQGSPVGDMVYKEGDTDVFYAVAYNYT